METEILLCGVIRVGQGLGICSDNSFRLQSPKPLPAMLMPAAKGLLHLRTKVSLEGPGLASVILGKEQFTNPRHLTPLSLSLLT